MASVFSENIGGVLINEALLWVIYCERWGNDLHGDATTVTYSNCIVVFHLNPESIIVLHYLDEDHSLIINTSYYI